MLFLVLGAIAGSLLPDHLGNGPVVSLPKYLDGQEFRQSVTRVDQAFVDKWDAADVEPVARADDLTIARRLSLALTGTIPSLEEIREFESRPAEGRITWWTARLLKDRRHSDYFAERLARAFVGVEDGAFLLYRRRRFVMWLADQIQEDRPYDELVRELISSDGLWTDKPATNFITAAIIPDSGDNTPNEAKLAGRVARAFLGVRLDCAECHDHPFDDWKQDDFQQLAAFFGSTENSLLGIHEGDGTYSIQDHATGKKREISPGVPFQAELLPEADHERQRIARWITHPENKPFARATVNRVWTLMFSRPLVEPVDNIPIGDDCPEILDMLGEDFIRHGYDLKRLVHVIAATRVFQLDSRADAKRPAEVTAEAHVENWAVFPLTRLRPEQVVGGILQAGSLETADHESHIVFRLARAAGRNNFVERYGDAGEDELELQRATIPQRLLLLNGELVKNGTKPDLFTASARIAALAPDAAGAIETAYLTVLSRRPTEDEFAHFAPRFDGASDEQRKKIMENLCATLINSMEFLWNH